MSYLHLDDYCLSSLLFIFQTPFASVLFVLPLYFLVILDPLLFKSLLFGIGESTQSVY